MVYTDTMKYFQKTIVFSLIVMLVSSAGGFCMNPMMAEANTSEMNKEMNHLLVMAHDAVTAQSETSSAIDVCVVDCVTTVLQITTTKKSVVDHILQVSSLTPLTLFRGSSSDGILVSDDAFGISPPSPDILSSVFKRE